MNPALQSKQLIPSGPNKALYLTAYSLRLAALCSGFRQQVSASVRPPKGEVTS